ncbi:MAG: OmpA family protein [Reyranella sp.]|uniref:OmpA family protein n=1 Tax=Reyranella sp. TaxID=1929291 RepID=UPI003D1337BD
MIQKLFIALIAAVALGACEKAPPPAVAPVSYMVFFELGSTKISDQSQNTVAQAAQVFKSKANARISVTGYADTIGSTAVNMQISTARANKVRDDLIANGVPAAAITTRGAGDEGLLVPTGPQTVEPRNRRAVIVITQ